MYRVKQIGRGVALAVVLACAGAASAQVLAPIPCAPQGSLTGFSLASGFAARFTGVSDDGLWAVGWADNATGVREVILHSVPLQITVSLGPLPNNLNPGSERISVSNQVLVVGTFENGAGTFFWLPPLNSAIQRLTALPGFSPVRLESVTHNGLFLTGIGVTPAGNQPIGFDLVTNTVNTPGAAAFNVLDLTEIDHLAFGVDRFNYCVVDLGGVPRRGGVSLECTNQIAPLTPAAPNRSDTVRCISSDGSVVGGWSQIVGTSTIVDAMVWRYGQPTIVGRLPGDQLGRMAGLNGDGTWGVGMSFAPTGASQAFLFDSLGGTVNIRPLLTALRNEFCVKTSGWTSLRVYEMSSNGVIVGEGVRNGLPQAFVAAIDIPRYCFADITKDGVADAADISLYLGWLSGTANTYTGAIGGITLDINRDGIIGDAQDIADFITLVNAGC